MQTIKGAIDPRHGRVLRALRERGPNSPWRLVSDSQPPVSAIQKVAVVIVATAALVLR